MYHRSIKGCDKNGYRFYMSVHGGCKPIGGI